jgi:hypothetical protein
MGSALRHRPVEIKAGMEGVISDMAFEVTATGDEGEGIAPLRAFGGTCHGAKENGSVAQESIPRFRHANFLHHPWTIVRLTEWIN